ncbi:MAG: GNAT family N-acetyltransferase [Gemmatimonadota bacterium]
MRLGPLEPRHRAPVAAVLEATNVFSPDEVAVALELFDDGVSGAEVQIPRLASLARDDKWGGAAHDLVTPSEHEVRAFVTPSEHEVRVEGSAPQVPQSDYEFLGAFGDDDTLLGYACFGPTPSTDGTYDLYWLAVHPDAHGHGVGRALVRAVEETLTARSVRMLVAETSSRADYENTRRFYTRAGYAEAARVRDFYRPADDRIIYTTRLTSRERGAATR